MNDNYYPKDQIILTQKEKQQFLAKLPSIVPIDAGIKRCVDLVNEMPYFLTQSSCEGQNINEPNSSHMPVPYLSIGVLYNEFSLLEPLADFLWEELKGKIFNMSIDFQVQAINVHKPINQNVPNFQRFLSIFLKSKRAIPLLEQALEKYSQQDFPVIQKDIKKAEQELAERYTQYTYMTTDIMNDSPINPSLSPFEMVQEAVRKMKEYPALSSASVRKEQNEFGEGIIVEFYAKDDFYLVSDLLDIECSYLTGDLIANETFQKTSSGGYLKKCQLILLNTESVFLFASILSHWAEVGRWENSPYWI